MNRQLMEEEEEDGEFSPIRCSSFSIGRSRGSALFSDSIPSESSRFIAYQPLSKSMRLSTESSPSRVESRKKNRSWRFVSKVFSSRKSDTPDGTTTEAEISTVTGDDRRETAVRKKKKNSWLPDPNRRWPVQGW